MALANDMAHPLRLEEEERNIRNLFASAHDEGRIEFISLGSTSIDDIYLTINRFHTRNLAIFHFSGHSNSQVLQLEDTVLRSQSLSKLLGSEPELKLVFLNGCANRICHSRCN